MLSIENESVMECDGVDQVGRMRLLYSYVFDSALCIGRW